MIFALISYVFIAVPWGLCRGPGVLALIVAGFGRNRALAIASLRSRSDFPLCQLQRGKAFGITFLVFGALAVLFALRGSGKFLEKAQMVLPFSAARRRQGRSQPALGPHSA